MGAGRRRAPTRRDRGLAFVAGRAGGIVDQIQDGETGYLVDSPGEAAAALERVLADPDNARQMALRGKEFVRKHFLTPRLLRDWLALFNELDGNDTGDAELVTALRSV